MIKQKDVIIKDCPWGIISPLHSTISKRDDLERGRIVEELSNRYKQLSKGYKRLKYMAKKILEYSAYFEKLQNKLAHIIQESTYV